jgi:hypothetical protein
MNTFQIYLAGAMSNITFEESDVWRKNAKLHFSTYK